MATAHAASDHGIDGPLTPASAGRPMRYLGFSVGAERYGIDLLRVQQIRSWRAQARPAHSPPKPPEVIRFRGDVVPLVDLRRLFGLAPAGPHAPREFIVTQVHLAAGEQTVGLVVDAVDGEIDVRGRDRRDGPDLAGNAHLNVVDAIVTNDDSTVLTLLDLPRLVSCGLGLTATVNVVCPGCDAAPGVDCSSCLSAQHSPF